MLIQTGKMEQFPIVLIGKDYWEGVVDFIRDTFLREATIAQADIDRILVTDDPAEAAATISKVAMTDFGLSYGKPPKPRWWLGER